MTHNYNYGTLKDGVIYYAPVPLIIDGEKVWTNDDNIYLENGYFKVVRTEVPSKEGYYYTEYWTVEGSEIVQKWEEHAIEVPEVIEPTTDELMDILLGVDE